MKLSSYKVKIKFDKGPLILEQNNYAAKIVNAYIVSDLDSWSNNPLRNFTLKSACLVGLLKEVSVSR